MCGVMNQGILSPQDVYDVMRMKDIDGMGSFNHMIHTKQYTFLETKPIQNAVNMIWIGQVQASSSFMQSSTAYQALF